jgi:calpain-7
VTVPSSNASGTISLNLSYDGPFDGIGFTVTAYSGLGMRWDGPLRALPFDHRISGTLTSKTSGGNYTLPTYMINPQYCLRVPATTQDGPSGKTRVKASLHAPRDLPINMVVTWGRGKRVFEWAHLFYLRTRKWFLTFERISLAQSDIIATSGAYTYGFARLSADLPRTSRFFWRN